MEVARQVFHNSKPKFIPIVPYLRDEAEDLRDKVEELEEFTCPLCSYLFFYCFHVDMVWANYSYWNHCRKYLSFTWKKWWGIRREHATTSSLYYSIISLRLVVSYLSLYVWDTPSRFPRHLSSVLSHNERCPLISNICPQIFIWDGRYLYGLLLDIVFNLIL